MAFRLLVCVLAFTSCRVHLFCASSNEVICTVLSCMILANIVFHALLARYAIPNAPLILVREGKKGGQKGRDEGEGPEALEVCVIGTFALVPVVPR